MILQRDQRFIEPYRDEGCYLEVHLWYINMLTNYPMDPKEINEWISRAIDRGWIDPDCYVRNTNAIFDDFDTPLQLRIDGPNGHKFPPDYQCAPDEYEALLWFSERWGTHHFTAGNGTGIVTLDPWGESRTVRDGELRSKRIFRRIA